MAGPVLQRRLQGTRLYDRTLIATPSAGHQLQLPNGSKVIGDHRAAGETRTPSRKGRSFGPTHLAAARAFSSLDNGSDRLSLFCSDLVVCNEPNASKIRGI